MNVHKNARLAPRGREILVSRLERGEHPRDVGTAMGVSTSTVYKWWRRYRAAGRAGPGQGRGSLGLLFRCIRDRPGRKVVSVSAAGASSCFQRNSCRTAIPCRRATSDTDASGRSACTTIRLLSASLKRWRLPGGVEQAEGI